MSVDYKLTDKQRVNKHMACLYCMAELIESEDPDIDGILCKLVKIIPEAMPFPEKTYVQIIITDKSHNKSYDRSYISLNFKKSKNSISHTICINSEVIGFLSVYFDDEVIKDEVLLIPDEEMFINHVCERLGRVIERHRLSEELQRVQKSLEKKNTALSEVLQHIEEEKKKEKDKIQRNIESLVIPILEKMKLDSNPKVYIEILRNILLDINSGFGSKLTQDCYKLSPKETEICNLLKNGHTSKEIGEMLCVSSKTINKHRDNIRMKLGIKNRGINIVTFLKSMN